jgi:RNA polymerase-binding transcription factor
MDQARAGALLAEERARLERLIAGSSPPDPGGDLADVGDEVDNADRRNAEETGSAVDGLLRDRWAALQRAEARLSAGQYGHSVRSGLPIPDERLEADPLAELTVEEAAAAERGEFDPGDEGRGLKSARHPYEVLDDADITPEERLTDDESYDEPEDGPSTGIHIERDDRTLGGDS